MSNTLPGPPLAKVINLQKARRASASHPPRRRGLLYWTAALVTCANALSSATFAVLAVVATGGREQAAMQMAARSLPLAVASLVLVVVFSPGGLCTLTLVMAFVQLLEFVAGIVARNSLTTGVALLFTVLTMACAIPTLAEQVVTWRREAD